MHKKGNISILVLFVLLASSLLGVLTMTFVQHMMRQTATLTTYYQSYYLAKAGLEFSLAQLPFRGIGFEYTLGTGNTLLASNFLCASKGCDLSFSLSGTASTLSEKFWEGSGCASPFVLKTGQSLIFPLVKNVSLPGDDFGFNTATKYENLYDQLQYAHIQIIGDSTPVVYGMLMLSGEELASDGIFFQTGSLEDGLVPFLKSFEDHLQDIFSEFSSLHKRTFPYPLYLMISSLDQSVSFCLSSPEALPTQYYYLKSFGHYHEQSVGLEASYRQPIPDFLMNTYGSYGNN